MGPNFSSLVCLVEDAIVVGGPPGMAEDALVTMRNNAGAPPLGEVGDTTGLSGGAAFTPREGGGSCLRTQNGNFQSPHIYPFIRG